MTSTRLSRQPAYNNKLDSWRTLFRHWRARVGPVAGDGRFRHRPLPRWHAGSLALRRTTT